MSDADADLRRLREFGGVGQRLRDEEVRSRLRGLRQALGGHVDDRDWNPGALRERLKGCAEAVLGEDGGVDTPRKVTQLVEGRPKLFVGFGEELGRAVRLGAEPGPRELQRKSEGEQALLGAVMEIAFQPAPLIVADADNAGAGDAELGDCARNSACSRSFSSANARPPRPSRAGRAARGAPGRGRAQRPELGRAEARVTARLRPGRRQLDRRPLAVDVRPTVGQPESNLERGVSERPRERVPHRARRRVVELDDEVGGARTCPPAPEQACREGYRDAEAGDHGHPEPAGCLQELTGWPKRSSARGTASR